MDANAKQSALQGVQAVRTRRLAVHPSCRPLKRAAVAKNATGDAGKADADDDPCHDEATRLPSVASVMSRRVPVLKHVPKLADTLGHRC